MALKGVHVARVRHIWGFSDGASQIGEEGYLAEVRQTCLRAVVQLPRVAPEAYSSRTAPPVDLVRQVWGLSDGASQIGEGGYLAMLLPRDVEAYLYCWCTSNRHVHVVSVLLSEMVRPNAPKTLTETTIIRFNPRGDCGTMHASSAYSSPN